MRRWSSCGAPPLSEDAIGRMVGDGAATLIARAFAAAGLERPADALDRFLSIYDGRLLNHTRPYAGIPELLAELASRSTLAVLTNKPLAARRAGFWPASICRVISSRIASSAAMDRSRASPIPGGWLT